MAAEENIGKAGSARNRRVLALDVGARRIGVAVSDPMGITAQGLPTIWRKNRRADLAMLSAVLREYDVAEVIMGLPLRMSGAEGTQSEKMRAFADDLRKNLGVTVHLWDERLTTAEAQRLLKESNMSTARRSAVVDQMAAVLILQSWLQARG